MADLDPLIKLRKHDVEERQKKLAALYREAEALEQQKQAVLDEMQREKEIAQNSDHPDTAAFLGSFLQGAWARVEGIDNKLSVLTKAIADMQEDVRRAFAEMKKVEIVQRNRDAEERREEEKRDSDILDEIAIESYRRHLDDE